MEEIYLYQNVLESILDERTNPTNLPLQFLRYITKNFSKERIIGSGGFGLVYKGMLKNRIVAVKRLFSEQTITEETFYREVDNLMAVKHRNIVQFLGFCANTENIPLKDPESQVKYIYAEKRERLLCFEYISNGSLQSHLTSELRGLEWHARYQLIRNICEGLRYLHEDKHMIHRDLKPDNVLLDDFMVPKIADLGISKLLDDGASKAITNNPWFSQAYCAPEFMERGEVSFKLDIYSLGVIITELVTGRRRDPNVQNVLQRWRYRWNKMEDTTLQCRQVAKCIHIGRQCRKEDPEERPSISKIMSDLNEMDDANDHNSNTHGPSHGQIIPGFNDLLWVEPLELFFPFEINKEISYSLHLTNETNGYIAFNIETTSQLPYCTQPNRGIVPPLSSCRVNITLEAQENAPQDMQHADEFIVKSTKVNEGLTAEDITEDIFSKDRGNMVDEVNLDVIQLNTTYIFQQPNQDLPAGAIAVSGICNLNELEASDGPQSSKNTSSGRTDPEISSTPSNELIQVDPLVLIFPLELKDVEFLLKIINITDDYVAFHVRYMRGMGKQYTATPKKGVLSPRSMVVIDNTRVSPEGSHAVVQGKELVYVDSTIVSKNFKIRDITFDLFDNPATGSLVHGVRLPVILVATSGPRSWEVMPYSIPSLSPTDKHGAHKANFENSQISSSTSNELVQVEPHEFIYSLEPNKVEFLLRIINITDDYVAFYIRYTKSTSKHYTTTPKKGILSPRSMVAINFTRGVPLEPQVDVKGKDLVFLDSTVVSKGFKTTDITLDLFDKPETGRLVHGMKLPVILVATNGQQSWEVTSSLSPTDEQMTKWLPSKLSSVFCDQNESVLTWVNSIDVHPTEPWIMTTQHDPYVCIWNYQTQQVKRFILGVGELQVTSVKFIPREQWIVAGTSYGVIYLFSYDPLEQIRVLKAHSGSVNSLAIHPTEPHVLSASFGGEVQLRDYEDSLGLIETYSARIWCARSVAFDPSGTTFASACGDSIKVWNLDSGECKLILCGHSHEVTCLEYFTCGDKLYLLSGSQDRTAKIWDCETGRCVKTLHVYSPVRTVSSHPDRSILITGSYDGSVRIWNSTSFRRERILKFDVRGVNAIACLKGSTRIVIGHAGGLALAEIGPDEPVHDKQRKTRI